VSAPARPPPAGGQARSSSTAGVVFEARRTGWISLLFAALHPRCANAVSVTPEAIRLTFGSRLAEVPLGDVETVDPEIRLLCGADVRIRHAGGELHVSGLSRAAARGLADALETARRGWWRRTLAERTGALRAVRRRISGLAGLPKHLAAEELRMLPAVARTAVAGLSMNGPAALSEAPEFRELRDVLAFLEAPDDVGARANETFVENELNRSREFFDRIEARPLTEEQRRAVVVDDRRNLVVAAAGSGKTSVIVAKAGWLVRNGYWTPSAGLRARRPQGDGSADRQAPRRFGRGRRDGANLPQSRHGDHRRG